MLARSILPRVALSVLGCTAAVAWGGLALARADDAITIDSTSRAIATATAERRPIVTQCYRTILPPHAIFQSKECGAEIAQDSGTHAAEVPPQGYVQIGALFAGPGAGNAAEALDTAYDLNVKDPSVTLKNPPKAVAGFAVPFHAASYGYVETLHDGSCVVTDEGEKKCDPAKARMVAVLLYFVDAPPNRYLLGGKPVAMFSILCKVPEGPNFEQQEFRCRDVATSFRFR